MELKEAENIALIIAQVQEPDDCAGLVLSFIQEFPEHENLFRKVYQDYNDFDSPEAALKFFKG